MASREAQGWQISVIIFAILTLLLAVSTYVGFRQAQAYYQGQEIARQATTEITRERNAALYRLQAHKLVLGLADRDAVAAARGAAGGVDDPAIENLLKKFDEDMGTFPDAAEKLNYRNLADQLLLIIQDRNSQLLAGQAREQTLETARTNVAAASAAAVNQATLGQQAAAEDLSGERSRFNDNRTQLEVSGNVLASKLVVQDKACKAELARLQKERDRLQAQSTQLTQNVDALRIKLASLIEGESFENPDGKIQWVSQRERRVWINLGLADGLGRHSTFTVFDRFQSGVAIAKPKGRIEVLQITDAHAAECRILDDKVADPILPGDLIYTPAWQPGQRLRFALIGLMNVNGDGVSDRELIKNVITMNGGLIDAELTDDGVRTPGLPGISINTRYLVMGDRPTDKSNHKLLAEYANLVSEAQRYGVETISVQKLLNLMGWKVEEKTLQLTRRRDASAFAGAKRPAAD